MPILDDLNNQLKEMLDQPNKPQSQTLRQYNELVSAIAGAAEDDTAQVKKEDLLQRANLARKDFITIKMQSVNAQIAQNKENIEGETKIIEGFLTAITNIEKEIEAAKTRREQLQEQSPNSFNADHIRQIEAVNAEIDSLESAIEKIEQTPANMEAQEKRRSLITAQEDLNRELNGLTEAEKTLSASAPNSIPLPEVEEGAPVPVVPPGQPKPEANAEGPKDAEGPGPKDAEGPGPKDADPEKEKEKEKEEEEEEDEVAKDKLAEISKYAPNFKKEEFKKDLNKVWPDYKETVKDLMKSPMSFDPKADPNEEFGKFLVWLLMALFGLITTAAIAVFKAAYNKGGLEHALKEFESIGAQSKNLIDLMEKENKLLNGTWTKTKGYKPGINELEKDIADLKQQKQELMDEQLKKGKAAIPQLQANIEDIDKQIKRKEKVLQERQEKLGKVREGIKAHREHLQELVGKREEAYKGIEESATKKMDIAKNEKAKSQEEMDKADKEIDKLKEKILDNEAEIDALDPDISEELEKLKDLEETNRLLQRDLDTEIDIRKDASKNYLKQDRIIKEAGQDGTARERDDELRIAKALLAQPFDPKLAPKEGIDLGEADALKEKEKENVKAGLEVEKAEDEDADVEQAKEAEQAEEIDKAEEVDKNEAGQPQVILQQVSPALQPAPGVKPNEAGSEQIETVQVKSPAPDLAANADNVKDDKAEGASVENADQQSKNSENPQPAKSLVDEIINTLKSLIQNGAVKEQEKDNISQQGSAPRFIFSNATLPDTSAWQQDRIDAIKEKLDKTGLTDAQKDQAAGSLYRITHQVKDNDLPKVAEALVDQAMKIGLFPEKGASKENVELGTSEIYSSLYESVVNEKEKEKEKSKSDLEADAEQAEEADKTKEVDNAEAEQQQVILQQGSPTLQPAPGIKPNEAELEQIEIVQVKSPAPVLAPGSADNAKDDKEEADKLEEQPQEQPKEDPEKGSQPQPSADEVEKATKDVVSGPEQAVGQIQEKAEKAAITGASMAAGDPSGGAALQGAGAGAGAGGAGAEAGTAAPTPSPSQQAAKPSPPKEAPKPASKGDGADKKPEDVMAALVEAIAKLSEAVANVNTAVGALGDPMKAGGKMLAPGLGVATAEATPPKTTCSRYR